jgi:hypothetical protein
MNLLTQLTLGEIKEFLDTLNENISLYPCWIGSCPSQEDNSRVSLLQCPRGTVRGLKSLVNRILAEEIEGHRYNSETLVDVRYSGWSETGEVEGSMTLGMLIASIRTWKDIGE